MCTLLAGPSADHDNIVSDLIAWATEVSDRQSQGSAPPDTADPDDVPGGEITITNCHMDIDHDR